MKVLDLQCSHGHVFEGWFGSEEDFQSQRVRGFLTCPMCGDDGVSKKLSAPRLNLHTARGERDQLLSEASSASKETAESAPVSSTKADSGYDETHAPTIPPSLKDVAKLAPAQLQAALLHAVRHVVANTEDVGDKFPEEARKIHYGETQARNIRGHATPEETEELMEEGITVMPLPLPDALKEPLQ